MDRTNWSFSSYIEEIILLSEITEIPGIIEKRIELLKEVWYKFPRECEAMGLRDGLTTN